MKRLLGVIIIMFVITGCAGWQGKATGTYELAGAGLATGFGVVKPACDAGSIKVEDCTKFKAWYNAARPMYITAGDLLILAINTEDAVRKQELLTQYSSLMAEFGRISLEFMVYMNTLGLVKGVK